MAGNGAIYPRLSNDGRRVLFMEQGPEGKSWLSVAPSDGSKAAVRVSDTYPDGIGTHYSWSPDDRSIEFEPNVDLQCPNCRGTPWDAMYTRLGAACIANRRCVPTAKANRRRTRERIAQGRRFSLPSADT